MTAHLQERAGYGIRATVLGVCVNALLALIKFVAGVLGSSQALIADAVESIADIVGSLVVLGGLRVSSRPPDLSHPYGHGKAEPLAAIAMAGALALAAVSIARESVRQILTPHAVPAPFTLGVLVGVIAVKELLFRRALMIGDKIESSAVVSDAWHHRSDAITSLAAFIGIVVALIGGAGWESADDWAALFAAGVIIINAFWIARPAVHELMDRAPDPAVEEEVRYVASAVNGVMGLHRCLVRKMGYDYYVDLDVIVDRSITVYEGHEIAHRVQSAIKAANVRIRRVYVHVEPHID